MKIFPLFGAFRNTISWSLLVLITWVTVRFIKNFSCLTALSQNWCTGPTRLVIPQVFASNALFVLFAKLLYCKVYGEEFMSSKTSRANLFRYATSCGEFSVCTISLSCMLFWSSYLTDRREWMATSDLHSDICSHRWRYGAVTLTRTYPYPLNVLWCIKWHTLACTDNYFVRSITFHYIIFCCFFVSTQVKYDWDTTWPFAYIPHLLAEVISLTTATLKWPSL